MIYKLYLSRFKDQTYHVCCTCFLHHHVRTLYVVIVQCGGLGSGQRSMDTSHCMMLVCNLVKLVTDSSSRVKKTNKQTNKQMLLSILSSSSGELLTVLLNIPLISQLRSSFHEASATLAMKFYSA